MKIIKKNIPFFVLFLVILIATFTLSSIALPKADKIRHQTETSSNKETKMEILRLSAIGDSLTEGVGDTTNTGGYVPLLQTDLGEQFPIEVVQAENFGKSGDRSDQILKRLKKDEAMQESVKKADVITMTVGGNDLMKAIQSKMFNKLSLKSFARPQKKYQKQLEQLYEEIRSLNPSAPIYQLGIYNPFYKNFSEIKEMQEIVDFWDKGSKDFVDKQDNAYFVPINDEIYNGLPDHDIKIESGSSKKKTPSKEDVINDLISEDDSFHPNNLGYQIISNAFKSKMEATKKEWLK
ncbi:SGNH/GDSL hydrolase family protein [Vagococcus carniphilus]|uniref:SGNH/GDSL hydrolase family protein n=1 Tax=Vagococcus carniphilus TaxID=218144 RepID=A0AAW8U5X7_9ENTE|nr:SGNH/GDSL hydrolase family protein [Vagococcus carniphilus]MDT2829669.1 SGNH/GDSL hydrolase family protein [Vagococcus carniphilus]MDT2833629.1 SGNH/GDSL hydrolase family protein [Vagococcus carniphilus]MDT2839128.1 SGNH/GDSL hydrolase family protein [Vagococcus carniphilus]MDT2847582.1 SGNH/GDSL hydrolase family protein [Vagococcus carniphilus]MDT2853186.1 SGNH/GDSL hydrolase family protein [Vagococcus carniphilus]